MAGVEQKKIEDDEDGMRLDRWFKDHYPGLGFGKLQKLIRSGQVRIDGKRAKSDTRVQAGETVRVPPIDVDHKSSKPLTEKTMRSQGDGDLLAAMLLHEDPQVLVFNKPSGLAVQGPASFQSISSGILSSSVSHVFCTATSRSWSPAKCDGIPKLEE